MFSIISVEPALLGDLPSCCKPADGPGIVIDLTTIIRWQLFVTWIIKLLTKCLMEGTLYIEGLLTSSFIFSACSLICYGNATLHMVRIHYFVIFLSFYFV